MPRKPKTTPPRSRGARRKMPPAATVPAEPAPPCFSATTADCPVAPIYSFPTSAPEGPVSVYRYDEQGRLLGFTDPPGPGVSLVYPSNPSRKKAAQKQQRSPRNKKGR